jgi:ppGpp synthetase/RelA/SpoT-type nucleotidyltranferase
MTRRSEFTKKEKKDVDQIVKYYEKNRSLVQTMLDQLKLAIEGSSSLMVHVHSLRWRTKDPEHLRDKLYRKLRKAKKENNLFDVTSNNLFERINDLAGFRILHLHTQQIIKIDQSLRELFKEYRYELIENPQARTWDDEYREFYAGAGINTVDSPKMYTSVHYVIASNSETKVTCELQVRTLAEELWGEVDHSMNYPHESAHFSCREQIKVLARVTSSCSRLVDSIFRTAEERDGVLETQLKTRK